jgi:hypothetical protein
LANTPEGRRCPGACPDPSSWTSPKPGAAFGDTLGLEARASSPNGPVTRVEFIGEYGTHEITLFSTFKGHAIKVNWPGPVLFLELAAPERPAILHVGLRTGFLKETVRFSAVAKPAKPAR